MADQFLSPIPYLYQGDKLVRVVIGPDREPWFVAADICRYLGLKNTAQAVSRLDNDEKATAAIISNDTSGQGRGVLIVSEPGFYSLATNSRKPEATAFKRWINHEVLPSIRRTGGYRFRTEREATGWMKEVTAVRLAIAEIRRCFGPQEANRIAISLWARVDIVIEDQQPPQGELPLEPETRH